MPDFSLSLRPAGAGARLDVHVIPRARRGGVDGIRGGRLLVRVTAAPVDLRANEAVVAVLADALGVPRRMVRVVGGATSRRKVVEISGLSPEAIGRRLEATLRQE
jgi:uncharacterized protein YggU (UPF0235/DUF167 family)